MARALVGAQPCLDLLPGGGVDDPQGLDGPGDVLASRASNPPARALAGDAQPLVRVPGDLAGVALVREHRPDGGVSRSPETFVSPTAVVRGGGAGAVQLVGDLTGRSARREGGEDLPDGVRLGL